MSIYLIKEIKLLNRVLTKSLTIDKCEIDTIT